MTTPAAEGPVAGAAALGPFWHVGVLVQDLDAAMRELTLGAGIQWCEPQTRVDETGQEFRLSFSTQAPFLELIEGHPGTLRDATGGPRLHHLAFFTDRYAEDKERLECSGFGTELEGSAPFGGSWCYSLGSASGVRVELCETSSRDGFLARWGLTIPEVLT